ncbi:uncharacterized protein [Fopius arisanus]|uniref:LIN28A protein n=1 Tax=Fopius arisanus TaxID=64838 RepID=A0A0C9RWN5_9HYME|nr:PREDICTED: uncharacterized protein LOC105269417 isoform X2 [Fopius arisanus]
MSLQLKVQEETEKNNGETGEFRYFLPNNAGSILLKMIPKTPPSSAQTSPVIKKPSPPIVSSKSQARNFIDVNSSLQIEIIYDWNVKKTSRKSRRVENELQVERMKDNQSAKQSVELSAGNSTNNPSSSVPSAKNAKPPRNSSRRNQEISEKRHHGIQCYKCHGFGHRYLNCTSTTERLFCVICGTWGAELANCPRQDQRHTDARCREAAVKSRMRRRARRRGSINSVDQNQKHLEASRRTILLQPSALTIAEVVGRVAKLHAKSQTSTSFCCLSALDKRSSLNQTALQTSAATLPVCYPEPAWRLSKVNESLCQTIPTSSGYTSYQSPGLSVPYHLVSVAPSVITSSLPNPHPHFSSGPYGNATWDRQSNILLSPSPVFSPLANAEDDADVAAIEAQDREDEEKARIARWQERFERDDTWDSELHLWDLGEL